MDDKRIRQLAIAILGIIVALGVFSLISTLIGMAVPLALLAVGGFAFYKIALEGRGEPAAMDDEVAESAGIASEVKAAKQEDVLTPEDQEQPAKARLSAVEQAQSAYVDQATPAEEILEQIKSRKARLQDDDET